EDGYLSIERKWAPGDKITLSLDMPVELIKADDRVAENKNKRAVQRGPLVYCVEQIDNATTNIDEITISRNNIFTITQGEGKLNNMKVLTTTNKANKLTFIPYFAWDNREPGKMEVWINYKNQNSLYTN
ncbi:MAG: hypothetical protein ACK5HT_13945, partial [Draconibacterium sp.]